LNFCAKLNRQPSKIGASDLETLLTYGFTEQQILETVLLVGWVQFANVAAFDLGTIPDFHNRGVAQELGRARAEAQVP
jgi:alkylhydroperoxidase family enzyme